MTGHPLQRIVDTGTRKGADQEMTRRGVGLYIGTMGTTTEGERIAAEINTRGVTMAIGNALALHQHLFHVVVHALQTSQSIVAESESATIAPRGAALRLKRGTMMTTNLSSTNRTSHRRDSLQPNPTRSMEQRSNTTNRQRPRSPRGSGDYMCSRMGKSWVCTSRERSFPSSLPMKAAQRELT